MESSNEMQQTEINESLQNTVSASNAMSEKKSDENMIDIEQPSTSENTPSAPEQPIVENQDNSPVATDETVEADAAAQVQNAEPECVEPAVEQCACSHEDSTPSPEQVPEANQDSPAAIPDENADAQVQNAKNDTEPEFAEPETDYSASSREELIQAFEQLLSEEVPHIKNRVANLRLQFNTLTKEFQQKNFEAFLSDGGAKEDYQPADDPIADNFRKLYNAYRDKRIKYQEAIENQKKKNLAEKQQILDDLRKLIDNDDESLKNTYDQFNAIQDKWKTIGEVPRENINDLWQNYHFLIEQFFNKVKINKELRMLDLKRNLEQKISLCEKAEELIVETSIVKSFKALQALRDQWKEIGPVPAEHNEEIWQRFCNAANRVDERRKEFYDQRREEFDKNLLAKQALIDKAVELTENTPQGAKQWNDITDQLDELLKIWKTIGPVSREANESVWQKFKGTIDAFYLAKKEYFEKVRDDQTENYNRKVDLCLKAEAIAKREDWKNATDELLQLQKEWKTIGNVSRKVSDKVWLRFRSACDEFFAKKNEFFKDIRSSENENLAKKEAIISQLKDFQFGDNKEENLNAIKDFQRQWMEIGFVPIKEKDRLQKEFRSIINSHFEKLKISIREAEENAFRERVQKNIGSDAKHFVSNERQNLLDQIDKLRNDLSLWENNLGFLANSKQADLLKIEFDKKMQNARQQIALLQAKLHILDETDKEANQ